MIRKTGILFAASLLGACQGPSAFTALQSNLSSLADSQAQALAKLDAISEKLDGLEVGKPSAKPGKEAGPKPGRPDPKLTYKVDLEDAQRAGSPEALVTIVEWSDFQCPYCSRVTPTITQLKEAYGDELAVVFKHNPLSFHPRALPAAVAAEAAGKQGKFWEMHDKLFANNKALTDDNFVVWAKELNLDVETFKKDVADETLVARIKKQQAQGMRLGAMGTPAFFVNGRFLSGAQPLESFKQLIDEEKKKAAALVASGTPRAKVYATIVGRGRTSV